MSKKKLNNRVKPIGSLIKVYLPRPVRKRISLNIELLESWPSIVGRKLAKSCIPIKIVWPIERQKTQSENSIQKAACLVISCKGYVGMEISHRKEQIIEQINSFFGYQLINRLRIEQDAFSEKDEQEKLRMKRSEASKRALLPSICAGAENIKNESLKDALIELGSHIYEQRAKRHHLTEDYEKIGEEHL